MKNLTINLENCFGIGRLYKEFDFLQSDGKILIYAPNGMMKDIKIDGNDINPEAILVMNAEDDIARNEEVTTFLAREELKKKYDQIYQLLEQQKAKFIKELKNVSKSTDCEEEVVEAFRKNNKDDFFACLCNIQKELNHSHIIYDFAYNDIFDKKGNVKKFVESNRELIKEYFNRYTTLLEESCFFNKNHNGISFGTYQANQLLNSLNDNSFFYAEHKIYLKDGNEITSADTLKTVMTEEIDRVLRDDKIKQAFDKIDRAIGKNIELRQFKNTIENNQSLITNLLDFDKFKREVWYGFFYKLKDDANTLINIYKEKYTELQVIINEAKDENKEWQRVIKIFKDRFFVPFSVDIENKEDVILKQTTANLIFSYEDNNGANEIDKDKLLKVLRKGEYRAFNILQFLFEIEARKKKNIETLIILDDIADSFDYKNKYAIIEYLNDISEYRSSEGIQLFKLIMLTHNFDFYRTICSRLNLNNNVYMAIKRNGEIILNIGEYRKNIFSHYKKNLSDFRKFISAIPFLRNIVEYLDFPPKTHYEDLTCCLHQKRKSLTLQVKNILHIFSDVGISISDDLLKAKREENILDSIKTEADAIMNDNEINEITLENKIVLSIAIRLKAEEFILNKLGDEALEEITSNQTQKLISKYKEKYPESVDIINILNRVSIMTPENIHVNTFMYEPLIDMSVLELRALYKDISEITQEDAN